MNVQLRPSMALHAWICKTTYIHQPEHIPFRNRLLGKNAAAQILASLGRLWISNVV